MQDTPSLVLRICVHVKEPHEWQCKVWRRTLNLGYHVLYLSWYKKSITSAGKVWSLSDYDKCRGAALPSAYTGIQEKNNEKRGRGGGSEIINDILLISVVLRARGRG